MAHIQHHFAVLRRLRRQAGLDQPGSLPSAASARADEDDPPEHDWSLLQGALRLLKATISFDERLAGLGQQLAASMAECMVALFGDHTSPMISPM